MEHFLLSQTFIPLALATAVVGIALYRRLKPTAGNSENVIETRQGDGRWEPNSGLCRFTGGGSFSRDTDDAGKVVFTSDKSDRQIRLPLEMLQTHPSCKALELANQNLEESLDSRGAIQVSRLNVKGNKVTTCDFQSPASHVSRRRAVTGKQRNVLEAMERGLSGETYRTTRGRQSGHARS